MKIEFFVQGTPAPGGSKNGFPFKRPDGSLGVRMVDAGKGNAEWKKVVAYTARAMMNRHRLKPLEGALRFSCQFVMPRGTTVKRRLHTVKPDLSKLIRSTEDAMTDIVWVDDCQIVEHGPMRKRYQADARGTGALITVETIEDTEEQLDLSSSKSTNSVPVPAPQPPKPTELEDSPFS